MFKVMTSSEWEEARRAGVFLGSAVDIRDGFIHFSSREQTGETVARHFAGAGNLVLAAVDANALGAALRWEASRGGALFPHLFSSLALSDIVWTKTFDADKAGDLQNLLAE